LLCGYFRQIQVVVKIDVHTITYQQLVYAYTTLAVFKLYVAETLYNDSRIANEESVDRVLPWRTLPWRTSPWREPRRGESLAVESPAEERVPPRRDPPGTESRRGEIFA
jgi:hypothetical protein